MGKMELSYWDIHGLASPIRFLLELVGADYKDIRYGIEDKEKWFAKKETIDLDYPNLPYLADGDVKITEHSAIMRYIARKFGLFPTSEREIILCDQAESLLVDIHYRFARVIYDTEHFEKSKAEWLEVARKKFGYINKVLDRNQYLTGGKLTYADVLLYDLLLPVGAFEPSLLIDNPNLARHKKMFGDLPQIKNYFAGKGKQPFISRTFFPPFAQWKASL